MQVNSLVSAKSIQRDSFYSTMQVSGKTADSTTFLKVARDQLYLVVKDRIFEAVDRERGVLIT
jgi:hypothetical protein